MQIMLELLLMAMNKWIEVFLFINFIFQLNLIHPGTLHRFYLLIILKKSLNVVNSNYK